MSATGKLYLGLPAWSHKPWRGTLYTREATVHEYLPQYAQVFNAIEGNTTFYGVPKPETVARWAAEAPEHLRFCWKFPKTITHELQLVGAEAATREFLGRVAPLGTRLGPFFIQLHDRFGPPRLRELETYLRALPGEFRYAVEVRHPAFFAGGEDERAFDALLGELGIDRVSFDTVSVHASTAIDPHTLESQQRKPRLPRRTTVTGPRPFVRFVGDPDLARNDAALREWGAVVARWLGEGREVYFFVHHPNDDFAPQLARRFQALLHEVWPAVPLSATWPGEHTSPAQLELL